jgi:hypothetical protein
MPCPRQPRKEHDLRFTFQSLLCLAQLSLFDRGQHKLFYIDRTRSRPTRIRLHKLRRQRHRNMRRFRNNSPQSNRC